MKLSACLVALCSCAFSASLLAGAAGQPVASDTATEPSVRFPFEFDVEYGHMGDSVVRGNGREIRDFDESHSLVRFVYTPRIMIGILRLGATYERYDFGVPINSQLEQTLQSASGVIGLDTQLSDSILIRLEAQPGLYGVKDDLDGDTFNVPFIAGGTYLYSDDLQFVLGVSVDFEREYPVYPGGGIRWRLGPLLVLNAVAPTPRLEYEATDKVMLYFGANLKGSSFRVSDNFGTRRSGDPRLDHEWISYLEVRAGVGVEVKITPEVKFSSEVGYLPYRDFDYDDVNIDYQHGVGSAYFSMALHAAY